MQQRNLFEGLSVLCVARSPPASSTTAPTSQSASVAFYRRRCVFCHGNGVRAEVKKRTGALVCHFLFNCEIRVETNKKKTPSLICRAQMKVARFVSEGRQQVAACAASIQRRRVQLQSSLALLQMLRGVRSGQRNGAPESIRQFHLLPSMFIGALE